MRAFSAGASASEEFLDNSDDGQSVGSSAAQAESSGMALNARLKSLFHPEVEVFCDSLSRP